MKAAYITETGSPDVIQYGDLPDPRPTEQQVLVKKTARAAQAQERTLWDAKSTSSEEKLKAAGVEFITVDKKPFYEATASVREKYGAPYADLIKRIEAVQ